MNRHSLPWGAVLLSLVAGAPLAAQQSSGAFRGRVTDSSGGSKVGISVIAVNKSTGYTRAATTDKEGRFAMIALPVGQYEITYKAGTEVYKATVNAALGQDTDASFKFPAVATGLVEVIANPILSAVIDTNSAQIGTTVTSEVISTLPLPTHDINQAAVLAPGVQIVSGSNVDPTKKTSSYITTGEGMGRGTSFAVDGADNNSTDVGGYVMPVPVDAISEFQVVTNQYKAEFGRSTAGFFNVLTKSGGNDFAGLLSTQYTNQSMRARYTDEGLKQDNTLGIYAATISGPIVKDRLFFMVSAERQQGSSASYTFQPYSIGLDPSLAGIRQEVIRKNVLAKLDWTPTNSVTTSWTYQTYQDETPNQAFPRTTGFAGNVPAAALGTGANKTWGAGFKLSWTLSPSVIYESNMRYFDYTNGIHPHDPGPGNGTPMALLDRSTPANPRVDAQNFGWGGLDPNAIQNTGIKRFQWKNEFTYVTTAHTVKGGLEFQRTTYADQQLFFNETGLYSTSIGGFDYIHGWGPSVAADTDVLSVRFVANGFQSGISFKQYGVYLQDDFQINTHWNLYLGARLDWDTQLDYLQKYDAMYATIHANSPTLAGIGGRAPRGKKYFEPRFQALYKPDGDDRLVFKFGAGRFVANVIDNVTGFSRGLGNRANGLPVRARNAAAYTAQGLSVPGGSVASFSAGSVIGTVNGHPIVLPADLTPYNYANNVGGLRDYFRYTVDGWLTTATADTNGKSLLASDFEYPTTDAFNVGMSYRINEHSAFDATFIYAKSKHLTAQLGGADGSGPLVTEFDSSGNPISDNIFFSNQTATSQQLQLKYAYTAPNTSFIATVVLKDQKSSEGGSAGAFDASGATGGLYGEGARFAFQTNPERRSPGTERLAGTFQYSHRFSWGTQVSALASWHSGKAYDVIQAYNDELGPNSTGDQYHPNEILGSQEGHWAMDVSLMISQRIKFAPKVTLEPFVQVQNLLNNYDYGANLNGTKILNDGTYNAGDGTLGSGFGSRGLAYQSNSPRTLTVGARFTF